MKRMLVLMLALVLVLAMVPTVAMADGETVTISTSAELIAAINNQQPGQTWNIAAGVYDIGRSSTITAGGESGWYFPIIKDGITINGAGVDNTVITSSVVSRNGNWDSQDLIAIWGNDVTIQNLTIRPKMDTNKAIEVMGMNATLKNIDILHNNIVTHDDYCLQLGIEKDSSTDYWEFYTGYFAGSVYFNPQNTDKDIGNAVLDDVLITQAWIACSKTDVKEGTLTLTGGTTIDFRGSGYAGYGYGIMSKNPDIIVASDFTVLIDDTLSDVETQVFDRVPLGTKIIDGKDTVVTAGVDPTYTIVIPSAVNLGTLQKNVAVADQTFNVTAQNVIIEAGKHIVVSVASDFFLSSGSATLAYQLFNSGTSALATGATFASFTGDGTEAGKVKVPSTSGITVAGNYQDTMTFTIAYQ